MACPGTCLPVWLHGPLLALYYTIFVRHSRHASAHPPSPICYEVPQLSLQGTGSAGLSVLRVLVVRRISQIHESCTT